ncbi:hypothetical protein [Candidatus Nanohalococcus occultus]|uniref:hypothetical protein n=1 Tax=Candidatus Nanohalococcus occultus TaxID=2978047 RepID=UPI0039E13EEF
MVLQSATGLAYEIVQATWRTATLLVPVFLTSKISIYYLRESYDSLEEALSDSSREFVAVLALIGTLSVLTDMAVPRFKLIGDIIAVLYFGFLFWKF